MKCHFCKGRLVRTGVPYTVNRRGYHLVVDSLAGWVCKQCGENYFEGAEVDRIQMAVKTLEANLPTILAHGQGRRASESG